MNLLRNFFLLVFIITTPVLYSQQQADSLRAIWENTQQPDSLRFQALRQFDRWYSQSQPDSTLKVLRYYYQLAATKRETRHQYRALNAQGNIYRLKEAYDRAIYYYREAEKLAIQLNNPNLQAIITGNIGNVYLMQQKYQEAFKSYTSALQVFQQQQDEDGEGRMLTSLGSVNMTIGNYDMALDYFSKSLSVYNKNPSKDRNSGVTYMNIGWIHYETKKYQEALQYFKKALNILEEKNENFFIMGCYTSLAKIYQALLQPDRAYAYAQKGLSLATELDFESGILESKLLIAQLTLSTNVKVATQQAELLESAITPKLDTKIKRDIYELLYQCYKSTGIYDKSLERYERFTLYNDSLQLIKNDFAVAREAVKSEFEEKLREEQLENEKAQALLKLKQLKTNIVIVSISLLVLSLLIWRIRSINEKNKKQLKDLLNELEALKKQSNNEPAIPMEIFHLNREHIETALNRKLNDTDWNVLNILLENPVITNKEIAEKAFLSVDGIGSSLRRMYDYFEVEETKYKKIALLNRAIKLSTHNFG